MTNEIILPHNIKVMTNGAFRVQNGKERQLTDGQVVGADGILINPDGTLSGSVGPDLWTRTRP